MYNQCVGLQYLALAQQSTLFYVFPFEDQVLITQVMSNHSQQCRFKSYYEFEVYCGLKPVISFLPSEEIKKPVEKRVFIVPLKF